MLFENIQTKATNCRAQFVNTIKSNKEIIFLYAIFFIGVAIKLVLWDRTPYVSKDSVYYLDRVGIWLDKGSRYFFENAKDSYSFTPPLFLFLVKTITEIGFSSLHSALLINILFGSLLPIIVYYISLELCESKKIALGSSIIALFHPEINALSVEAQRDIGYLFFLCLFGLLILQYARQHDRIKLAGSSLCLICAVLFRIEAIEIYPILFFVFLLYSIKERKGKLLVDFAFFIILSCISICFICALAGMQYKDVKNIYNAYYLKAVD